MGDSSVKSTDIQRLRALAEKAHNLSFEWYEREGFPQNVTITVDCAMLHALDPATVIALCNLAEKANPEPAQAQVSDAQFRTALREVYPFFGYVHEDTVEQICRSFVRALSAPLPDGRS